METTDVDRENSDNLYNIRENADNLLSLKVLHANILEEYIIFIHLPFFLDIRLRSRSSLLPSIFSYLTYFIFSMKPRYFALYSNYCYAPQKKLCMSASDIEQYMSVVY